MKEDTQKLGIFGAVALGVVVGAVILFNLSGKSPVDTVNKSGLLVRENSHSTATGTYVYKITMVEFGDYQCPACRFVQPNIKKLLKEYSDSVKLVYRQFPLPMHKNSLIAAQAAEAAGEQGKFWEMHEKLYETQDKWSDMENPLNFYVELAKEFGMDTTKFKKNIEDNKFVDAIEKDKKDGNDLGISGTPTIYINGEKYDGPTSYEAIKAKIDSIPKKKLEIKNMKISSKVFQHNQNIPAKYTCDGSNVNPPLQIADVPENAKSLVLIVDDPDAPMGEWVHWTAWNMNPKTVTIIENSVPEGAVQGVTDSDKPGYSGPCPPSGAHRYFFKLFALNTTLSLSSKAKKPDIMKAIEGHVLDEAELVGLYKRK